MTLACPFCESLQVQKVSMVYSAGTTRGTSRGQSSGVAVGSHGEIVPVTTQYSGSSLQQTELAQALRPPEMGHTKHVIKKILTCLGIILICIVSFILFAITGVMDEYFTIGLGIVFFISLLILFISFAEISDAKESDAAAGREYLSWNKKFVCHTCGEVFEDGLFNSINKTNTLSNSSLRRTKYRYEGDRVYFEGYGSLYTQISENTWRYYNELPCSLPNLADGKPIVCKVKLIGGIYETFTVSYEDNVPSSNETKAPASLTRKTDDIASEIERLAALKSSGSISQEEFDILKCRIIQS